MSKGWLGECHAPSCENELKLSMRSDEVGPVAVPLDASIERQMNQGCIGCRIPGCRDDALLYTHNVRCGYAALTSDNVVLSQDT
jgi:hypothetical protein